MSKRQIIPLPFLVYFSTVVLLVFVGFVDSLYLSWSHYRNYSDMAYKSFCAISRALNCDTVSQSPYAIFLNVPVAVWGAVGYFFFGLFLPFAFSRSAEKKRIWTLLFVISLIFSLISIALALVSTFYIHSYCLMCILVFGVNFLLLFYTWMIRRRFRAIPFFDSFIQDIRYLWTFKKKVILLFSSFLVCVLAILIFYPHYWEYKLSSMTYADIPSGITEDGHPWIGAENPRLTIVEFSDYVCFQCRKMNFYLRQIIAENPDKIRLVHRHYPMDSKYNFAVKNPFHEGSAKLALMAIYAATKGKFWETHDIFYNLPRSQEFFKIKDLAEAAGLDARELAGSLRDRKFLYQLRRDLGDGFKLGINGTPSYLIDGKVYEGQIPPEIIKRALEE